MIFDDVDWTYRKSARGGRVETDGVRHDELSTEERNTPHIREVCELLVMQHPDYVEFTFTDEPPPEVAAAGHDRCIVPIRPENIDAWLTPDANDPAASYRILDDRDRPYYEHRLAA